MLLIAAVRNEVHMGGRTNVAKMLEQGKQITAFPINTDSLTKFAELAKKHKLACGYIPDPQNPATTNVVIKAEDAELANKIRKDAGIEILPGIDEKKTERQSVRQRVAEINGADFAPFCRSHFGCVPCSVIAHTAAYCKILFLKVNILPS